MKFAGSPVHSIVIAARALPVDLHARLASPGAEEDVVIRVLHGSRRIDACGQGNQICEEAAVERQLDHAALLDDVSQFTGLSAHQGRRAADLQNLRDLSDIERDIYDRHLVHVENYAAAIRFLDAPRQEVS